MARKVREFYIYLAKGEQAKAYYEDPQTTVNERSVPGGKASATRPRPGHAESLAYRSCGDFDLSLSLVHVWSI